MFKQMHKEARLEMPDDSFLVCVDPMSYYVGWFEGTPKGTLPFFKGSLNLARTD